MRHQTVLAAVAAAALTGVSAGPSGLAASAATDPPGLTSSAPVTVVASGLDNPRGLAWGPDGHLLVAEAGITPSLCQSTSATTLPAGPAVPEGNCYGLTGEISDISAGRPVPIVTGLASIINSEQEVLGANGLAYVHGQLYTTVTQSPEAVPSGLPADLTTELKKQYGALLSAGSAGASGRGVRDGRIRVVANPGNVDYQWSQAHQSLGDSPSDFPAANPNGLTPRPGGGFYLVDSGSNTLDSVGRRGDVHVLAFIPHTPAGTDAVPTCVAVGPGGSVYVGQITGFGNSATAANVYRYDPRTGSLAVWQSGFSAINGCGFGANGDFYVTELDTTGFPPAGSPGGAVIQISPDGTRTVLGAGQLFAPGGFLAGPGGSIYVSNHSLMWPPGTGSSAEGEVVKIG
jgi:sugar lactone lactonase YvrE